MKRRSEPVSFARRRARKRYVLNAKRFILSALFVMLLVELGVAAFTSPWFSIKRIRFTGNETVASNDISRRLSLRPGTNIFRIDKRAMADRVMENPVVNEVRLYRRLPDILIVRIVERTPDLILNATGAVYEVDSTGVPFRVAEHPKAGVPILSCKVPRHIVLGRPIRASSFNTARKCLLLVREKKIFQVAEITVDQSNDLCLNVRDGFQVKLGRPEQLSAKLDMAARVVEQIPEFRQRGAYIDLTVPEAPALKYKE
ncbi:MAG TPA: FtsQ-type POTRA domain-containing protein [Armatimonadota bacterium]|nr:FtsQ-type POTRA domain-containing protein [Armatimonadota bacterium]